VRRRRPVRALLAGIACLGSAVAIGQQEDLTLPPRLDESPGRVRLAAPPESRRPVLEEIIVTNESEWRLPDLGSEWRARREDERASGRIEVSLLPIYDPEGLRPDFDPLRINREVQQVGFLELFRVRFGRRATP
jgi:hypothetical protein